MKFTNYYIMRIAALVAVVFMALALLCLVLKPEWLPFVLIGVVIAFVCVVVLLIIVTPRNDIIKEIEEAANDFRELLKLSGAKPKEFEEMRKKLKEFEEMRKKLEDFGCMINDDSVTWDKKKPRYMS